MIFLAVILLEETSDGVSHENEIEETVGTLFVPEGMWRGTSAFVISWVNVFGISNIHIGLSESRDFSGDTVPVWQDKSSNLIWNSFVKLWEWDEELLPEESVTNLHDRSNTLVHKVFLFVKWDRDVGNRFFELWEVFINNEIGIFFWNDKISKLVN